jgi:hypothetical protein
MNYIYDKIFSSNKCQLTLVNNTTQTKNQNTLFLLYGAKNTNGIESSYLVAVFDNKELCVIEKDKLDKSFNLTSIGKTINNVYIYKHYIIECELNKNYNKDIENYMYLDNCTK